MNRDKTVDKSQIKLTRKQKNFADELLADRKISATEAVMRTYNVAARRTAETIASENLRKPEIMAYLDTHVSMAKGRIVELAIQDDDKRLALDASKDILDRTLGKATQKIQTENSSVVINLTLN
jgi:phage terminase small subunit